MILSWRESGKRLGSVGLLVVSACGGDASPSTPTEPGNRAPEFQGVPLREARHNRTYQFQPRAQDPDGDSVTMAAVILPDWLTFEGGLLSGRPGRTNIGPHTVHLQATDGTAQTDLIYGINVVWGEIVCDEGWPAPEESPYILPYPPGKTHSVIQSYCSSFSHSGWFAYDFDTQIGDTLVASRAGDVIFMQEGFVDGTGVYGEQNFMMIQHDDGSVAFYVHLMHQGALFDVGDRVEQGEPFALSGNSGSTSEPHLHMVVFYDIRTRKENSAPLNFRNAEGELDANGGLALGRAYAATAW